MLGVGKAAPAQFPTTGRKFTRRPRRAAAKSALRLRLFMPMAKKASSARSLAPPFQLRPTSLGPQLVCRPAGGALEGAGESGGKAAEKYRHA